MKIIDNNKDYYDYLQGIWGQDPKAVFLRTGSRVFGADDRPPFLAKKLPDNIFAYQGEILCRCGDMYHYIYFENRGEDITMEEFFSQKQDTDREEAPLEMAANIRAWKKGCPKYFAVHHSHMRSKEEFIKDAVRYHSGPYYMFHKKYTDGYAHPYGYHPDEQRFKNPILSSFPMTVIPAEKVFIEIQDFLLSRFEDKTVHDSRTDVEKLESAGFDRKTSFRNVK